MKKIGKIYSTPQIKKHLASLKAAYNENQAVTPEMIEEMKEMRECFIEIKQPTLVKSIRLVYEYLQINESLDDLPFWEAEEIVIDEENPSYTYYLGLLENPSNKFNREEIRELNSLLKEMAQA